MERVRAATRTRERRGEGADAARPRVTAGILAADAPSAKCGRALLQEGVESLLRVGRPADRDPLLDLVGEPFGSGVVRGTHGEALDRLHGLPGAGPELAG